MKLLFISITILFLPGCSLKEKEIRGLDFPYKKNYQAEYASTSIMYREDGTVRTSQTDTLLLKIGKDLSEKGSQTHEWLLLPGVQMKNIPDTMLSHIDPSGLFIYYAPDLLPDGQKEIQLIKLPLKEGLEWGSHYLSFPARARCTTLDSTVSTGAGTFQAFVIQYEFHPFYMDDHIEDPVRNEVRGVVTECYAQKVGKVSTSIDYFVTERKTGERKWKLLSNESILSKLTIP